MKKLLIIAYDFPPYVSVGALRPYSWYKYLKEFGIEPVVVTRQWDNKYGNHLDYIAPSESEQVIIESSDHGTIIRAPYKPNLSNRLLLKYGESRFKLLRKLVTAYYEFAQYILPIGTKYTVYKAARNYLKENQVDAIIATGDPYVLFRYAHKLSKVSNTRWIADYRDPWNTALNSSKNSLVNIWNRIQEKRHVKSSMVITTVDELFKYEINKVFPNKRIETIANGYDPEPFMEAAQISQNPNELRIAFVGTIYNWHPIRHFLNIFETFVRSLNKSDVKLVFYGTNIDNEIKKWINEDDLNINRFVEIHSKMNNADLIRKLATDNVMLLFNYYSFTGTKIYDYLALKRQILFCFLDDAESKRLKKIYYFEEDFPELRPQEKIIRERNAGVLVKDGEHLISVLHELYNEFRSDHNIHCNSSFTEDFSRKSQTAKLAHLIIDL